LNVDTFDSSELESGSSNNSINRKSLSTNDPVAQQVEIKIINSNNYDLSAKSSIDDLETSEFIWKVDDDSAELEAESSSDKKRRLETIKRRQEEEEEEEEEARRKKQQEEQELLAPQASQQNSQIVESKELVQSVSLKDSNISKAVATNSNEKSGFNIGLLMVFPLIIGSSLFFLLFPYIGEVLSKASTPIP
jgi:hypothetical protein